MNFAVGIITAPRDRPTLEASVESLRHNGGYSDALYIFSDGGYDFPITHNVMVRQHEVRKGNLRNWHYALRWLYEGTDAEWLIICEDDITWAMGAFAALSLEIATLRTSPHAGAFSLFLPVRMAKLHEQYIAAPFPRGWARGGMQIGNKMWGAQCLMFNREQAQWLLMDPDFDGYLKNPRYTKNVDAIVAHCLNQQQRHIYWRNPCLVDHKLGEGNSSLGYAADRPALRSQHFTGYP